MTAESVAPADLQLQPTDKVLPSSPESGPDSPARRAGYGATVVVVGAGSDGYAVFERLVAAVRARGPRRLTIVLVDPHAVGAGRRRLPDRSRLLRTNARAAELAVTDPDGTGRPGPSVAEWARLVRRGAIATPPDAAVAAEVLSLRPDCYPSRRLQSAYLEWAHRRLIDSLPRSVRVTTLAEQVTGLVDLADGRQGVRLANGPALAADAVILAQGRLDALPNDEHARLAAFAQARGLTYLPPGHIADCDLSGLAPGATVLVRGLGSEFFDLMALVTEGRGGIFESCLSEHRDGGLRYRASGREPVLYVGSRSGVPKRSRPEMRNVRTEWAGLRFVGTERAGRLSAADIRALVAKELGWAYYREFYAQHPDRVTVPWTEFDAEYEACGWFSDRRRRLVERAVAQAEDRWEIEDYEGGGGYLRELAADPGAVHEAVGEYLARDLAASARGTTAAVHRALIECQLHLLRLAAQGVVDLADVTGGWWHDFFSCAATGPAPFRLRQLLALAQAGVVRFAGPATVIGEDAAIGLFRAWSPVSGSSETGTVAVEAYLPAPPGRAACDRLFASLLSTGQACEEATGSSGTGRMVVSVPDGRIRREDGTHHPRRFALGWPTTLRGAAEAGSAQQAEAVAEAVLELLRGGTRRAGR
jgi:hypothetical protein